MPWGSLVRQALLVCQDPPSLRLSLDSLGICSELLIANVSFSLSLDTEMVAVTENFSFLYFLPFKRPHSSLRPQVTKNLFCVARDVTSFISLRGS